MAKGKLIAILQYGEPNTHLIITNTNNNNYENIKTLRHTLSIDC